VINLCLLCDHAGNRGAGAKCIVLEEAAFIDPNLFFKVVVPIHSVNNTSLIAISTPDDEFNYFSKLLELKRDDKDTPLFLTLQVWLVSLSLSLSLSLCVCV